jgi:site-specific recombinase XerD
LLASTHTDRPKDIRDRAVILLLATYGFRVDEVRRLRLDDFDWEQEIISVTRSKQRQAQQYPLSRVVGEAVLRYLKEVRPRVKDRSLFLTLTAPYRGFRPGGLWPAVGPRVRALGIRVEHTGPHCLRHACAARLLSQRLSYKQIADHLGHRSLEATRIYAKVDLARLREVGNFDLGGLL